MGQLRLDPCDSSRELVSASLDGELAEFDAVRLDAHLAVCSACRTYAAGAAEAARLLREAPLEHLTIPILLPSRRLAVARKLQVAAAAAALAVTVGLSAAVSTISSRVASSHPHRTAAAAKLRFPEQELRMLQRASQARANRNNHSRLVL
jgi:predicted anti-sigma-YlaC factor YlaD